MEALNIGTVYICKVKKILQHGIIVEISDLGIDGFIHISELSKRWVRDVKDIAKEGDKIVCKLIKLEPQSTELSAKRVTDNEKKQALREWSIEKRVGRILEDSVKDVVPIKNKIKAKYGSYFDFYAAILKNGKSAAEEFKLGKDTVNALLDFVEKTKKKITIKTELTIQDFSEDGVENIKKLLLEPYSDKKNYSIKYIKAPVYLLTVNAGETKKTLSENKKVIDGLESKSRQLGIDFKYREIKE